MSHFEEIGRELGALVDRKRASYGSSTAIAPVMLRALYPNGIAPAHYETAMILVRVMDKMARIVNDPNFAGEDAALDLAGYGLLLSEALKGVEQAERARCRAQLCKPTKADFSGAFSRGIDAAKASDTLTEALKRHGQKDRLYALDNALNHFNKNAYLSCFTLIESPFSGDRKANGEFLRAAMADCFARGEIPTATHAMWPSVLDDSRTDHRSIALEAGAVLAKTAKIQAFYLDRGFSQGMLFAMRKAVEQGRVDLDLSDCIKRTSITHGEMIVVFGNVHLRRLDGKKPVISASAWRSVFAYEDQGED